MIEKDIERFFVNAFMILGLFALALIVTYRVAYYTNYLYLEREKVIFDWTGGVQGVCVHTDAGSWIIEEKEYVKWVTFEKRGNRLYINAYQNDDNRGRSTSVFIRTGFIKGVGNSGCWLEVFQQRK